MWEAPKIARIFVARRIFWTGVLPAVVGLLSSCASSRQVAPETVHLDEADSGRTIDLRKGQVLILTLRANVTTGYAWKVTRLDERVLCPLGEAEYRPDPHPPRRVGVGGRMIYRFRASDEGSTHLELVYRRPWMEHADPARTFSLTVVVR